MTTDIDKITAWCRSAATISARNGFPEKITDGIMQTIEHFSKSKRIYEVASELAEIMSHMPLSKHESVHKELKEEHGFSFDFFTDKKMKKVTKIIKRGKINSEAEYRIIHEYVTDVEVATEISLKCDILLGEYDAIRDENKSQ